jgi:TolA-binding protein
MKNLKLLPLLIFSLLFTFCGGKTDKELFDEAVKLSNEKKYDDAIVAFENIETEFKESELAPKALFESAKIYQGQVIKKLNSKESLLKSIEVYKKVYENYPNSYEAENSLFMSAFIYANDLNDLENAKLAYELYLEKFPDGVLAKDARIELENLGKTPEQILMEKIQIEEADAETI